MINLLFILTGSHLEVEHDGHPVKVSILVRSNKKERNTKRKGKYF